MIHFTAEQEEFRKTVARFVDAEVVPAAQAIDDSAEFPRTLFRRLGELGYLGLRYPEQYGGADADMTTFCLFAEELARGSLSVAAAAAMQSLMGTHFIFKYGSDDLRQRYLVPALRGDMVATFALTEPNAGSDLANITTRAERRGEGWVLRGAKTWVTNAPVADVLTVAAKTSADRGMKSIALFLLDRGAMRGISLGKKIDKMSVRASETGEILLDDVEVSAEHCLGGDTGGVEKVGGILAEIRVMTAALSVGLARAAYEAALAYARQRVAFGKPIVEHQAIGFKLADMLSLGGGLLCLWGGASDKGLYVAYARGERRGLVEDYYAGVDWTSPVDVDRVVAAYERVLNNLDDQLANPHLTDPVRGSKEQERAKFVKLLKRDGFVYDDGRLHSAAAVDLRVLVNGSLSIDVAMLADHIARIEKSMDADPAQAIGSAKELVETVAKTVLAHSGEMDEGCETLPQLVKKTLKTLDLSLEDIPEVKKGAASIRMVLASLGQIVAGISELRNEYGTGHGRLRRGGLQPRHARLTVSAAATLSRLLDRYARRSPSRLMRPLDHLLTTGGLLPTPYGPAPTIPQGRDG